MAFNKKSFLVSGVLLTVVSLTLSSIASAQDRGPRGKGGDRTGKTFERLDADQNGVLTVDELTEKALEKADKRFERKDADDDGFLTFEEATSGREEPLDLSDYIDDIALCVADIKAETGDESIEDIDAEAYQSSQEKFDNTDTSGDGLIDLAEMQASATEKASVQFAKMDADESGDVTLEEFTAHEESRKATRRVVKSCIDEVLDEGEI